MRLSDYKNEEALDLLADLMDYVAEILSDDKTMEVYKTEKKQSNFVKYLIKNHKSTIIAMLARIDGTPVQEYECDFFSLPSLILEMFNNKMIVSLFQSQDQSEESYAVFWSCYGKYTGRKEPRRFLNFVLAELELHDENYFYQLYTANSMYWNSHGKQLQHSFTDIMEGNIKVDNRSGDEIAEDVINRLGLKVKGGTDGLT